MGAFSIWHWLIVLVVVLILFGGRGKISGLMGDLGKGLKAFKSNIKEDTETDKNEALTSDNATVEKSPQTERSSEAQK